MHKPSSIACREARHFFGVLFSLPFCSNMWEKHLAPYLRVVKRLWLSIYTLKWYIYIYIYIHTYIHIYILWFPFMQPVHLPLLDMSMEVPPSANHRKSTMRPDFRLREPIPRLREGGIILSHIRCRGASGVVGEAALLHLPGQILWWAAEEKVRAAVWQPLEEEVKPVSYW